MCVRVTHLFLTLIPFEIIIFTVLYIAPMGDYHTTWVQYISAISSLLSDYIVLKKKLNDQSKSQRETRIYFTFNFVLNPKIVGQLIARIKRSTRSPNSTKSLDSMTILLLRMCVWILCLFSQLEIIRYLFFGVNLIQFWRKNSIFLICRSHLSIARKGGKRILSQM